MNKPYQFHNDFDCSVDELIKYRIRFATLSRPKGWRSSVREMLIEQSNDGGDHWNSIPLRLDIMSKLVLWTSASPFWPPEVPVGMGCEENGLWFDYVDAPDEEPRWMRSAALWRAAYLQTKKRWRIKRLSAVDSEK